MSIFTAKPNLKKSLAILALAPLVLTGCVSTASDGENGEVNLINNGVLTVCTNTPYMPFEYEENGKIVGIDADIANAIAKDLGAEAQLTSISFEGLDSGTGLTSGQCDIALAGISVTDERKSKMKFTDVYFEDRQFWFPKTLRSPPSKILRTPKSALSRQPAANPMPKKKARMLCSTRTTSSCSRH